VSARPILNSRAVADIVGGRLVGSGEVALDGVRALESAGPGQLSFLVSTRYLPYFRASRAGAVLIAEAMAGEPAGPAVRIVVPDVQRALEAVLLAFHPPKVFAPGVDPSARIGQGVSLGPGVSIGPQVIVGDGARIGAVTRLAAGVVIGDDVVIGSDCTLDERVICCAGAVLGDRVRLKAGAVISGQGFGYASDASGHRRLPHVGRCVLEDDVEVGSNSCIDRGTLEDTVIGRGTKIDNLVQVGHNVVVGEHSILCGQAGIAGSARLERRVTLAGQVGVNDHITIGEGSIATGQAGVTGNLPGGGVFSGMPAAPHRDFLRRAALIARLPELARRLDAIERRTAGAGKGGKPWKSE